VPAVPRQTYEITYEDAQDHTVGRAKIVGAHAHHEPVEID
jgi:hypothetical protein